ncbi:hypothetical protein INR49_023662, partial [Caranx melampygus]
MQKICKIKRSRAQADRDDFTLCREEGKKRGKYASTDLSMTGLLTLCACCRQIPEPCLPSGAHKSLRGMNETDIKETNCGVILFKHGSGSGSGSATAAAAAAAAAVAGVCSGYETTLFACVIK